MPGPEFLLAGVMVLSLTVYALLGGADYGAGIWDLVARGKTAATQRDVIAHAIAPVWEANHVWLILVVTVLFTAFPPAFAAIGTYLHIPLAIALAGIVLRGSAFVFRAYGSGSDRFVYVWGRVFAVASGITPLLLGIVVGAITEGRIGTTHGTFLETYVMPWATPFALSVGLFAFVLFAYLAAVYLTLEAREPEVKDAFRGYAVVAGALTGVLALSVFVLARQVPHVQAGLSASLWAIPLHTATGAAALFTFAMLFVRQFWWARAAAAVQVALIIGGWALTQYPYLVRPSLTIYQSAAPRPTLVLLLQVLFVGACVLIPALLYLFRIFGPRET